MKRYNPSEIEPRWHKRWDESQVYAAEDFSKKPKFTMLTEFPYPSGAGLHMGHLREYTLGDIIARHKRANGFNVLFPMGFDCFGLPTENYAIKNKISPQAATDENTAAFRKQLSMMGYSIDWNRSFNTSDPEYYRWTQWMFLQFYKAGLAYQDEIAINWCPFCKTGLANEEVINGRHERCDNPVEKKMLKQWMLRITDYADKLIDGLASVDYPPRIADQQINWIGRSEGAEIDFVIDDIKGIVKVFTTRPDTIFGATFMVLAPEHPLAENITADEYKQKVKQYIEQTAQKSDIERQENKAKTGVFTGAYVNNPATEEKIPVWIADYVLGSYGEGAIMAVPAHDERDYEFAKKFSLPIVDVVIKDHGKSTENEEFRDGVTVFGYHPDTDEFLIIDWGDVQGLVSGGIENGETYEECARRELAEETGVDKVSQFVPLGEVTFSHYFHSQKNINRVAKTKGFLAIIDKKDFGEDAREEHEKFVPKWVSRKEFIAMNLVFSEDDYHWDELRNRAIKHIEDNSYDFREVYSGHGIMVNSGKFNDKNSNEAGEAIIEWLEEKGVAKSKVNYKLRDWVYSRQHYWGEPIPIIHCQSCGAVPVPEDQLPVELPAVDYYEPTDDGKSPLSRIESWVNTTCPKCGKPAKRETDTMPNWAGSNWYYLRYYDAHNNEKFADPEKLKYWDMVDLYLGGMEHTTLHLLYSRFHHQFLHDQGLVPTSEPYAARRGQGIILAADGVKMSKSLGNVVDPTEIIESGYGADATRLTVTFLAPYDQTTPWSPETVAGCYRFLGRVWQLGQEIIEHNGESSTEALRVIHKTVKKVSEDLDKMNFNTPIAAMMEAINELNKIGSGNVAKSDFSKFMQILSPFAPHIAAELFEQLGNTETIEDIGWPEYDEKYLETDEMTVAVQVNGKLRGEVKVAKDTSEEDIKKVALEVENVKSFVGEKEPARIIYVPGKILNIVVK